MAEEEIKDEAVVEETPAVEAGAEVEESTDSDIDLIAAGIDKLQAENDALKAEIEKLKGGSGDASGKSEEVTRDEKIAKILARFNGTDNGSAPTREAHQESQPKSGQDNRAFFDKIAITPDDLH